MTKFYEVDIVVHWEADDDEDPKDGLTAIHNLLEGAAFNIEYETDVREVQP